MSERYTSKVSANQVIGICPGRRLKFGTGRGVIPRYLGQLVGQRQKARAIRGLTTFDLSVDAIFGILHCAVPLVLYRSRRLLINGS